MKILVLNSGSSSQKLCLYDLGKTLPDDPAPCLWEARVEWDSADGASATIAIKTSHGSIQQSYGQPSSRTEVVEQLLATLWKAEAPVMSSPSEIQAVGHRVVHGGPEYQEPTLITPDVKAGIAAASTFAPLHNRAELQGMEIIERLLGPIPQIAVFDTGFHRNMPPAAVVYPGPYEWFKDGIRRYGFHGINHQYCAERAANLLRRQLNSPKLVICHLGNGCSLAAVADGHSLDTTMGFTPLEGLMMGTRAGSIDPGILTYLIRQGRINGQELDNVLNEKSGLLGVSGISGDMRQILAAIKQDNPRAKLAFDIYVHRLQAGIGAMIGVLGGIDGLVFTAGVGENSPEVRLSTCNKLGFVGLKLDEARNARPSLDEDIAAANSSVRVLVIRAQEDWAIARECWNLTKNKSDGNG